MIRVNEVRQLSALFLKALEQVQIAKEAWIEAAKAEGNPIQSPAYKPAIDQPAS